MSGTSSLDGTGVARRATSVSPAQSSRRHGEYPGADQPGSRRDNIDRWSAALACGDASEVARLVQQSHTDRIWIAASGQLGAMLGQAGTTVPSAVVERGLAPRPDDMTT